MAEYNGGVLVDENGNKYYPIASGLWCKEGNYGDQFAIAFNFGNNDDNNKMLFQGAVGASGEHPSLVNLMTLSGKSGNLWVKGKLTIGNITANTTDTWIPVIKNGEIQYTKRKFASGKTHTDYNNNQDFLPTMSFLSYWNGAYNSNNSSNLTYAYQGIIQCKPTTLYDNSSGSNGTITLSSNISNFSYIEILFRDDWSLTSSEMTVPGRPNVMLSVSRYTVASQTVISHYRSINLNGTTLSTNGDIYGAHNSWNNSVGSDNCIYVYKVIGWK